MEPSASRSAVLHGQHRLNKMDNESFEAYASEVAQVNRGRLLMVEQFVRRNMSNRLDVVDVLACLRQIKESLHDMDVAAKTGEYPATV